MMLVESTGWQYRIQMGALITPAHLHFPLTPWYAPRDCIVSASKAQYAIVGRGVLHEMLYKDSGNEYVPFFILVTPYFIVHTDCQRISLV